MAVNIARTVPKKRSPYGTDYYSWALKQARALRERRAGGLDWDNLAEEVEDLGRQADALQSHFENLLEHLLNVAYAPAAVKRDNLRLWQLTIRNARRRIRDLLQTNPGLKRRGAQLYAPAWPYARDATLGALDLDDDAIPELAPWTLDQAIDGAFAPTVSRPARNS